jgi:predicted ArsR family transcriptional regulator
MNPPNNKGRRIKKINGFTQARLIKLLFEGIYSCQELAEETGLHPTTVRDYTRELHRAKAIHICAWEKDSRGRDVIKIYKIGEAKDAKRHRLTDAERQRAYRAKKSHQSMIHAISKPCAAVPL